MGRARKLTDQEAQDLYRIYKETDFCQAEVARQFRVSGPTACKIILSRGKYPQAIKKEKPKTRTYYFAYFSRKNLPALLAEGFERVPTGMMYFTGTQYPESYVLVKRPEERGFL